MRFIYLVLLVACGADPESASSSSSVAADAAGASAAPAAPSAPDLPATPADVAAPPADAEVTVTGLAHRQISPGTGEANPTAEA
ncbi:MAG: hypothetical protein QGG40_18185, partial [Myxococcota bacterium]|nr:hypothetical protein [Myxococcota bacterium]